MSTTTLEEVWALFRETDCQMKETRQMFQETDRKFQETEQIIKENALAAEKRSQELDRQLKENALAAEKRSQAFDRQLKETERLLRGQIGDLSRRLGDFVEGMIKPSAVKLFKERGIEVHKVTQKVEANNPQLNLATEIDLLVINGNCCILIEVKSNLSIDDVNEHIKRMAKFKPLFPEYADKKAFGAVAGMVIPDNVAKYAYKKDFFVIGQQGGFAIILNDQKFQPTAW